MEYIERVELQFWQAGQVCPHLLFLLMLHILVGEVMVIAE